MNHNKYWVKDEDFNQVPFESEVFWNYTKKELPFISQLYSSSDIEIFDKKGEVISVIGENDFYDWMKESDAINWYNRVCGIACVAMSIQWFCNIQSIKLTDLLQYRDHINEYIDPRTNEKKQHTYYEEWKWRFHRWLVRIAEKFWLSGAVYKCPCENIKYFTDYIQSKLDENVVLINSVKLWFNDSDEWVWGHLVVIKSIDHATWKVLIFDPYMPNPIEIEVTKLYVTNSFRFIELSR